MGITVNVGTAVNVFVAVNVGKLVGVNVLVGIFDGTTVCVLVALGTDVFVGTSIRAK